MRGWHIFLQDPCLPFSKKICLMQVLSSPKCCHTAQENLSSVAVPVGFVPEFHECGISWIHSMDFPSSFLQSTVSTPAFCILILVSCRNEGEMLMMSHVEHIHGPSYSHRIHLCFPLVAPMLTQGVYCFSGLPSLLD